MTAAATSCSQITLSWAASTDTGGSGLKGYNIYRNSSLLKQVLAPATSTADAGLNESMTYFYAVQALDNAGNLSGMSATVGATTFACATPTATNTAGPTPTPGASGGTFRWAKRFGGTGNDQGIAVAVDGRANCDGSGNVSSTNCVVAGGYFTGTADFGGGALTALSSQDAYLLKYTSTGTYVWAHRYGGPGSPVIKGVAVDPTTGEIIAVGAFSGTVNFGGSDLVSAGLRDIFVAKFTAAGGHVWSKRFGGAGDDLGTAVAIDAIGNVLITGFFNSSANFGGTTLASPFGNNDVFIAKFSPAGVHLWSKNFSNTSGDLGYGIAVDRSDNSVIITGAFSGNINFTDGGQYFGAGSLNCASSVYSNTFLARFHSDGTHWWSKAFTGTDDNEGRAVAVDSGGNVVATGLFQSTVNFGGSSLTSHSSTKDVFVVSYTADGTARRWLLGMGGSADDIGTGVAVDASNNVVLTGYLSGAGQIDFGGGLLTSTGGSEGFAAKYSTTGSHVWGKLVGGSLGDYLLGVATDATGNAVLTGQFAGSINFGGGGLVSAGGYDISLVSLGP